jgi:imidazolonepropionase-like amidohydrolase
MLRHAHEIAVPILAGSDTGSCGVPHGLGLLDEIIHMERAGLPSMAVLHAATVASARLFDFPDPVGQIALGFRARMILTNHDPLTKVANLRNEKTILFDGHAIHCPDDLDPDGL